jgi:hypothetical protein
MADFVLDVDEFAALFAGSVNHATVGRFALERLYKFNVAIALELGEGMSIAASHWEDLRHRLLRYYWSPVLAVQALQKFLTFSHPGNTSFVNFMRLLIVKYCHFRALLPTDAMIPHLTPIALASWALAKLHPGHHDRYHRTYMEQDADIIATFKLLLHNESIPRTEHRDAPGPGRVTAPGASEKPPPTTEAEKSGRLRPPPAPAGWTKRSAATVAAALTGRCRRCAEEGHSAIDCTAPVTCDHATSVDCGAYGTYKTHCTAGCPLTPPSGWTKP